DHRAPGGMNSLPTIVDRPRSGNAARIIHAPISARGRAASGAGLDCRARRRSPAASGSDHRHRDAGAPSDDTDGMHPPPTRPPPRTLAWVERTLGRGARVIGWRRLTGGLTSLVHRLTVEHNGRRGLYVLRRWVPDAKHEAYAIGAVASETAVLAALERSDVP